MQGTSLVAASGGHSSSRCTGLPLSRPLLLRSTGSRRAGSVVVARGHSRSVACGIFPDQGSNPCSLHWQADSQPLRHQGSPGFLFNHFPLHLVFLCIMYSVHIIDSIYSIWVVQIIACYLTLEILIWRGFLSRYLTSLSEWCYSFHIWICWTLS